MKKLAAVVMMITMATFMVAAMASADDDHGRGFHGQYAMTGPGACLYSLSPFSSILTLPGGNDWIASKLAVGTWTFERKGTGKAEITVYGIAAPQAAFPTGTGDSSALSWEFTYTVAADGTITGELMPGTFLGTYVTGPNAGYGLSYTVDTLSFFGTVSPDHKTLTLNSANEVQTFVVYNSSGAPVKTLYAICNYGRVLVRTGE
ncbi:MAG: hypothetical protein ACHQ7N_11710 [Candidatus Methylomirabilales bacterium]